MVEFIENEYTILEGVLKDKIAKEYDIAVKLRIVTSYNNYPPQIQIEVPFNVSVEFKGLTDVWNMVVAELDKTDFGIAFRKKQKESKATVKMGVNSWRSVADVARTTVGMEEGEGEPKDSWKKKMLLAEHSPIRKLKFEWKWDNLKSWVSVHFVRHKHGIEHWVKTQRTDRTGEGRDKLPQDSLVNHECEANAQALINISRKRLCTQASMETIKAWKEVKKGIEEVDPVMASVMVPECVYRGWCSELKSCGFDTSVKFRDDLKEYRRV